MKIKPLIIDKWQIEVILAWLLLFIVILLIFPSGFRGDVGPDSHTYRVMYEQAADEKDLLYFQDEYGFEPAASAIFSVANRLGISYEGLQLGGAFFSLFGLFCVFLKVKPINFVVFTCLYLCFCYYQLQWSVIRNNMAFWIFAATYAIFKRTSISGFASFIFHYSFFLAVFRVRLIYVILGSVCAPFLLYFYVIKYSGLSSELSYSFFFGGWGRLAYHILLALAFMYILGLLRLTRDGIVGRGSEAIFFTVFFFIGMMFPLGWRLVAVATPFLLFVDFKFISICRLIAFFLLSVVTFAQKSYSFTMVESLTAEYPVTRFLYEFYSF